MGNNVKQSYYLAEDTDIETAVMGSPKSAYNYDARGVAFSDGKITKYPLSNNGECGSTGLVRELRKTSCGVVTVIQTLNIKNGFDGLYIRLYDSNKKDAFHICTKNSAYCVLHDTGKDALIPEEAHSEGFHSFIFALDFDNSLVTVNIDDVNYGTVPLMAKEICYYAIGTVPGSVIDFTPIDTHIHANYLLNEQFRHFPVGKKPASWEFSASNDALCAVENGDLIVSTKEKSECILSRSFDKACGKLCYESMIFVEPKDTSDNNLCDFCLGFCSAFGESLFQLQIRDGSFCYYAHILRAAKAQMWYRLRFEIDMTEHTVVVKINGKDCGEFSINPLVESLSEIRYTFSAENTVLRIDRIKLYHLIDYPDYCPKPVLPKGKDNYTVGINMCSLWHTGSHIGWDIITPFEECKPVLGYYDEGIPEVCDWELKFMLEHGIDFQMYCWYASKANAPMKLTGMSEAIHDGYFNCKYSYMSKFAILFEAAGGACPQNSEAFRKYYIPYWIEHFFSDPRYMRIDNRAVMAVFGTPKLIAAFGGTENLKKEFDYLRSEVKKLGYDDMIIMSCGSPSDELRKSGFDAAYPYSWGKNGCDADFTLASIKRQLDYDYVHFVPTASTGFNNVAWAGTRSPNITPGDFERLNEGIRDDILPTLEQKPAWMRRFVMLSNWNEYGEGTYIMPTKALHGFGYLDAVRKVYTDERQEHKDVVPSENVLDRLSYLYPQSRRMIKNCEEYFTPVPKESDGVVYTFGKGNLTDIYEVLETSAVLNKDGSIKGISLSDDPKLILRNEMAIDMCAVTHLKLHAKVSDFTTLQIFYQVEGDTDFKGSQCFSFPLSPDNEYCVCQIKNQANLDKVITKVRIDPAVSLGIEYELYDIQLISGARMPEWYYNNAKLGINWPILKIDDELYMPFNPYHNVVYRLGLYYEYSDKTGELSFYSNNESLIFTIGKSECLLNGKKHMLSCPIDTFYGLPALPLSLLAETFGFSFEYREPVLYLTKQSNLNRQENFI